jgi:hypothetical protein
VPSLVYRKLSKVEGSTQTINYTYTSERQVGAWLASLSNSAKTLVTAQLVLATAPHFSQTSPSAESTLSHLKAGQELQAASCAELPAC